MAEVNGTHAPAEWMAPTDPVGDNHKVAVRLWKSHWRMAYTNRLVGGVDDMDLLQEAIREVGYPPLSPDVKFSDAQRYWDNMASSKSAEDGSVYQEFGPRPEPENYPDVNIAEHDLRVAQRRQIFSRLRTPVHTVPGHALAPGTRPTFDQLQAITDADRGSDSAVGFPGYEQGDERRPAQTLPFFKALLPEEGGTSHEPPPIRSLDELMKMAGNLPPVADDDLPIETRVAKTPGRYGPFTPEGVDDVARPLAFSVPPPPPQVEMPTAVGEDDLPSVIVRQERGEEVPKPTRQLPVCAATRPLKYVSVTSAPTATSTAVTLAAPAHQAGSTVSSGTDTVTEFAEVIRPPQTRLPTALIVLVVMGLIMMAVALISTLKSPSRNPTHTTPIARIDLRTSSTTQTSCTTVAGYAALSTAEKGAYFPCTLRRRAQFYCRHAATHGENLSSYCINVLHTCTPPMGVNASAEQQSACLADPTGHALSPPAP